MKDADGDSYCDAYCETCENVKRKKAMRSWEEIMRDRNIRDLEEAHERRKKELEEKGMKEYWNCDHEKAQWGGYMNLNGVSYKTKWCPTCGHMVENKKC